MNEIHLALSDYLHNSKTRKPKIRQNSKMMEVIVDIVSEYFKIPIHRMKEYTRVRPVVKARQISTYMMCRNRITHKEIAAYFGGFDRTFVIHNNHVVENAIETDAEYARQVKYLETTLKMSL